MTGSDEAVAPSPAEHERTIRYVDVEEVRLRTSVRGSGPPLLLVTGIGASLDLAEPFERELAARGVRVIGFDAPGIGRSTPYRRPRRMSGFARTVDRMLDALGHEQVDVFGVSLGGVAAQQLARQAPHRVRRLVLAATGPGLGGVPGSPRVLATLATPRRYYDADHYRRVAGRIYGGALRRDPDALSGGAGPRFLEPPSLLGYAGQLYAVSGWTSMPWLHRLTQPTLVLTGDDDPIVPPVNARILASRIPRARLHVLRGTGHLFILERPAETAELVTGFLDEGRAGTGDAG
ncbi:MAG TPA: alpha/beta fold hydrolase [Pseudonocardia sp.]|nr:alpha/beta fold hydrolase [Pseudonocardia sp.]